METLLSSTTAPINLLPPTSVLHHSPSVMASLCEQCLVLITRSSDTRHCAQPMRLLTYLLPQLAVAIELVPKSAEMATLLRSASFATHWKKIAVSLPCSDFVLKLLASATFFYRTTGGDDIVSVLSTSFTARYATTIVSIPPSRASAQLDASFLVFSALECDESTQMCTDAALVGEFAAIVAHAVLRCARSSTPVRVRAAAVHKLLGAISLSDPYHPCAAAALLAIYTNSIFTVDDIPSVPADLIHGGAYGTVPFFNALYVLSLRGAIAVRDEPSQRLVTEMSVFTDLYLDLAFLAAQKGVRGTMESSFSYFAHQCTSVAFGYFAKQFLYGPALVGKSFNDTADDSASWRQLCMVTGIIDLLLHEKERKVDTNSTTSVFSLVKAMQSQESLILQLDAAVPSHVGIECIYALAGHFAQQPPKSLVGELPTSIFEHKFSRPQLCTVELSAATIGYCIEMLSNYFSDRWRERNGAHFLVA